MMWYKEYLDAFLAEYEYPLPARRAITESARCLFACPAAAAVVEQLCREYRDGTLDFTQANTAVEQAAQEAQISPFAALLVFYMLLSQHLETLYAQKNIPHEIFHNTLCDLRYKAQECYAVHGVWGTFVAGWFAGFFKVERFALGRLQYEQAPLPCSCTLNGTVYPQGTPALNIHIPSAGPLRKEDCEASFALAKQFYGMETALFMCDSWLLYPAHRRFLPVHSGILMFMDFFTIVSHKEDTEFRDAWRVFGKPACAPYADLPQNTSLQRAYAQWLQSGNPTGSGLGVFLF